MATSSLLAESGRPGSDEFSKRVAQFNNWNEGGLQLSDPNECWIIDAWW
jgi:hypothetical protein